MDYTFSCDYFSKNIPIWDNILSRYKGKNDLRWLEIGCLEGRSSVWVLENILTSPNSKLIVCDTFVHGTEETFKNNIRLTGKSDQVEVLKNKSCKTLKILESESFDFIYVDGNHLAKNALTDIVLSWELLKNGGIMIIDDYKIVYKEEHERKFQLDELFRPSISIDIFLYVHRDDINILHKDYQVIIQKKLCMEIGEECGFFSPLGTPAGTYQYDWAGHRIVNKELIPVAEFEHLNPQLIEEFIKYRSIRPRNKLECLRDVRFMNFLQKTGMKEWIYRDPGNP